MAPETWSRKLIAEKEEDGVSRRLTLGPASFVDTPRLVTHPEIDIQSQRGSLVGSRPSSSGRGQQALPSSTSQNSSTSAAAKTQRMPSLSALGSPQTLTSTLHGTGTTGTGTTGTGSGTHASQEATTTTGLTEMGELSQLKPIQEAPSARRVPSELVLQPRSSAEKEDVPTPPPPPSAIPEGQGLSPPPARAKPWWKS